MKEFSRCYRRYTPCNVLRRFPIEKLRIVSYLHKISLNDHQTAHLSSLQPQHFRPEGLLAAGVPHQSHMTQTDP